MSWLPYRLIFLHAEKGVFYLLDVWSFTFHCGAWNFSWENNALVYDILTYTQVRHLGSTK